MTEYGHTGQKPTPLLSYDHVQERKATRKKLLETIFARRRERFKQLMAKKRRLYAGSDLI